MGKPRPRCCASYRPTWDKVDRCELPEKHTGPHGPLPTPQVVSPIVPHYQETSRMAYDSMTPHLGKIAREVLNVIAKRPSTTEEVEHALQGKHQTISAAVSNLWHKRGLIRPSGARRPTTSGRLADVYEVVR